MDTYNVNILDPDIKIFNGAEYIGAGELITYYNYVK